MFWYTNQPMGVNLIGKLFANAITNSGIDVGNRRISATSARKNLAQVGASASVPSALLSKMLGQKNLDSKVHYVSNTENIQKAASLVIARGVQGHDSEDFSSVYNDLKRIERMFMSLPVQSTHQNQRMKRPIIQFSFINQSLSLLLDHPMFLSHSLILDLLMSISHMITSQSPIMDINQHHIPIIRPHPLNITYL